MTPEHRPLNDLIQSSSKKKRIINHSEALTSKDDHIARERLELCAHGTEHDAAHRVVRDEEASMDTRVVIFDTARYERVQDEVSI